MGRHQNVKDLVGMIDGQEPEYQEHHWDVKNGD
jgi:hypothetical protein